MEEAIQKEKRKKRKRKGEKGERKGEEEKNMDGTEGKTRIVV